MILKWNGENRELNLDGRWGTARATWVPLSRRAYHKIESNNYKASVVDDPTSGVGAATDVAVIAKGSEEMFFPCLHVCPPPLVEGLLYSCPEPFFSLGTRYQKHDRGMGWRRMEARRGLNMMEKDNEIISRRQLVTFVEFKMG